MLILGSFEATPNQIAHNSYQIVLFSNPTLQSYYLLVLPTYLAGTLWVLTMSSPLLIIARKTFKFKCAIIILNATSLDIQTETVP